jgi:microsomal dipeptidase-like Zn-dependent dipeptidase
MKKLLLFFLLFPIVNLYAQNSNPRTKVLTPELGIYKDPKYEFSGLCSVNDNIYMLPENNPGEDPLVVFNTKTKQFRRINMTNLKDLKVSIAGFDGFEGITFLKSYFYITVETKLENPHGYVVRAKLIGDSVLTFDLSKRSAIQKPNMMSNTSFEAITTYGDSLLVAFEYNHNKQGNNFFLLDTNLSESTKHINFPRINYRLTDIIYQNDSLVWGILYNYRKDDKNYFNEIPNQNYFYLVALDIKNKKWDLKQIKGDTLLKGINWEGITLIKDQFYMINDEFYDTVKKTSLVQFPRTAIEPVPNTKDIKASSIDPAPRYTDLHAHVTLKAVYNNQFRSEIPKQVLIHDRGKMDSIDFRRMRDKVVHAIDSMPIIQNSMLNAAWEKDPLLSHDKYDGLQSGFKDYDQCSFTNIAQKRFSIICASITPPERFIVNGGFKLNAVGKVVTGIDKDVLLRLNLNSDLSTLLNEYVFLSQHYTENNDFPDRVIRFVKDSTDLDSALVNNQTAMIFTVEGAHVLSNEHNNLNKTNSIIGNGIERENYFKCDSACHDEVMFSIDVIKNLRHRLLFIEPSHFYWNNISGVPRSMDKPNYRWLIRKFPRFFVKKYAEGIFDTTFVKDYKLLHKRNFAPTDDFNSNAIHFPYQHRYGNYKDTLYPYAALRRNFFRPQKGNKKFMNTNGNLGWQVINKFLNASDNHFYKPTYIDMKHMDVESRIQYINQIKNYNDQNPAKKIPLLVSHTACSGENQAWARLTSNFPNFDKYKEIVRTKPYYFRKKNQFLRKVKRYKGRNYVAAADKVLEEIPPYSGYFYPWGVNLYDEEIEAVYESDGLIGLMADERTLGYDMKEQKKYYRKNAYHLNKELKIYNKSITLLLDKYKIPPLEYDRYVNFEPFLRNLIYTLNHLRIKDSKPDSTAWDHIAIGTDFDGFIDPINVFPSLDRMDALRGYIECYFDFFLKFNPHVNDPKVKDNDIWDKRIKFEKNMNDLLNKLFYENTERFIKKYF